MKPVPAERPPPRVLMLGWEFPPHISGGLGTACFGLTRGLRSQGVQVLMVVPRARGDEDVRFAEVLGCNQVPIAAPLAPAPVPAAFEPEGPRPSTARSAPPLPAPTGLRSAGQSLSSVFADLCELLAIDSPLRPYLTPERYAIERPTGSAPPPIVAERATVAALRTLFEPTPLAPAVRSLAAAGVERSTSCLEFSGHYGGDLMAEVARYALVVAEIARQRSCDVVHCHDWMTVPAGIAAARLTGKPLVVHMHACEYDRSGEHVHTAVRDLEQVGLLAADRVVCVSHYTASMIRQRYFVEAGKLRVLHNAITHDEAVRAWHWQKAIPEPIVLFLGRVTWQKGPDYFLEAAAKVIQVEPRVKFVVSGSGDLLAGMIERSARLGLARHMHFTGFLRGKDVERMYAIADLYVMPSVSEPFGISPLEAMALDVPVIVSRQSGVAEVLHHALKVDFWDVQDLADKILALLRYPALSRQLQEDGHEEVAAMRWEHQGRLLRAIYAEVGA
jgi:glycosyltransferase involved in cell wall biosynthesis